MQNTNLQLALFSHNIPAFLAAVDVVLIKLRVVSGSVRRRVLNVYFTRCFS